MPTPRSLHARSLRASNRADDGFIFESLEERQMLTITIVTPIADLSLNRGAPAGVVNLANRYTDPSVSNVVRFITNSGNLDMALFGGSAPNTVANFLTYVNSGAYNNSIFHRETTLANDGIAVLQGGGFTRPTGTYGTFPPGQSAIPQAIPTNAAINLENPTGNVRGSIAMARSTNINTATSQFFFNVTNNPSLNDTTPNIPDSGYAVFGTLFPDSLQTLDTLVAFQSTAFDQDFGGSFASLPLRKAPNNQGFVDLPIAPSEYLTITNASVLNGIYGQITAISANPSLLTASVNGGNLILTPVGTALGTVTITVRITAFDGTFVEDAFDVTITNPAPAVAGMQAQGNLPVGHSMLVSAFGVRDLDATGGGVGSVAFYFDSDHNGILDTGTDELLGADLSSAGGWNFRVATTNMDVGANTIFARVTDTENATADTQLVVTLRAAVPTGTITPDPTSVAPGQNVDIEIGGLPNAAGIRRVSIFLDTNNDGILNPLTDRLIGHATYSNAGTNWVFTVEGEDLSAGLNRIFARTTDSYGNLGGITSSIINVN